MPPRRCVRFRGHACHRPRERASSAARDWQWRGSDSVSVARCQPLGAIFKRVLDGQVWPSAFWSRARRLSGHPPGLRDPRRPRPLLSPTPSWGASWSDPAHLGDALKVHVASRRSALADAASRGMRHSRETASRARDTISHIRSGSRRHGHESAPRILAFGQITLNSA